MKNFYIIIWKIYNHLENGDLNTLVFSTLNFFPVETHWFVFLFIFQPSSSKFDIFITPVECLVFICKAHLIFTSETFHFYKWNIMVWGAHANLAASSALSLWSLLTHTEASHKISWCYRSKILFTLEKESCPLSLLLNICMGSATGIYRVLASLINVPMIAAWESAEVHVCPEWFLHSPSLATHTHFPDSRGQTK